MRFLLALALLAGCAATGDGIGGKRPSYLAAVSDPIANAQAIGRRFWAPGLDEGFVPQGLAIDGDSVLVSSYRARDAVELPTCRVFRVDRATGRETGFFDAPAQCDHAAGLAMVSPGMLVLADIHHLWRIDLAKALAQRKADGALRGHLRLAGSLEGHFSTFDGQDLWIGMYTITRDAARAYMHRLPLALFDEFDGRAIDEKQALESVKIPPLGQGAAFARGEIWLATSTSKFGTLARLERATGRVVARYEMVSGIEGVAFDPAGRLWAVSEAGARKYMGWEKHFPLIFEVDTARLVPKAS